MLVHHCCAKIQVKEYPDHIYLTRIAGKVYSKIFKKNERNRRNLQGNQENDMHK